jgi:hypothetical protein
MALFGPLGSINRGDSLIEEGLLASPNRVNKIHANKSAIFRCCAKIKEAREWN